MKEARTLTEQHKWISNWISTGCWKQEDQTLYWFRNLPIHKAYPGRLWNKHFFHQTNNSQGKKKNFLHKSQLLRREFVRIRRKKRQKTCWNTGCHIQVPCGLKGLVVSISWSFPSAYRVYKEIDFKPLSHFCNILTCKDAAESNFINSYKYKINQTNNTPPTHTN